MLTIDYLENCYRKAGYHIYHVNIRNALCAVNPVRTGEKGTMVILCDNWENQLLTEENINHMRSILANDKMLPDPSETDCLFLVINRWKERSLKVENVILVDNGKHRIHKGHIKKSLVAEEKFVEKIVTENTMAMQKFYHKYYLFEENHRVIATYLLIAINVICYMKVADPSLFGISRNVTIGNGNWNTMNTYMFMHSGLFHLVGNMIALYMVGSALERSIGALKLSVLYIISGVYGAVFSIFFTRLPGRITVGASGAILGLMGALVIITAFSLTNANRTGLLIKSLMLVLISGFLTVRVDNLCHIGGLIGGLIFGLTFQLSDRIEEQSRYIGLQKYFLRRKA